MNNDILLKVKEIVNDISNTSSYKKLIRLKKDLQNNQEIMTLLNEIKVLKKDVVHHVKEEESLKEKEKVLNDIPLYREYLNTLDEVNNIYLVIENTLNNYFQKKMN